MAKISSLKLGQTTLYPKSITNAIADITGIREKHILNEILKALDDQISANTESIEVINGNDTISNSVDNKIKTVINSLDYTDTNKQNEFVTSVNETDGIISVERARPTTLNISRTNTGGVSGTTAEAAIVELQKKIDDSNAAQKSYKIVSAMDSIDNDANVKEAWKIQESNNNGEYHDVDGSSIVKIYKDVSLTEVYLGSQNDTIDTETGIVTKEDDGDNQSLNFVYHLEDGTYTLAKVDLGKFLTQSEFKDGLKLDGNVVSVKIDNTNIDSQKFLYLKETSKGENKSIALSGITAAIEEEYVSGKDIRIAKNSENKTQVDTSLDEDIKALGVNFAGIKNGDVITKGSTLTEILKQILIKQIARSISKPTTILKGSSTQTIEVGNTFNATLDHTYNDGSFNGSASDGFNPTSIIAGCKETETRYNIGGIKQTSTTVSKVMTEQNLTIGCETDYSASTAVNKFNNGKDDATNIPSGTATSSTTYTISGRFKYFVGYTSFEDVSSINSTELISSLNSFTGWINMDTTSQQIITSASSNGKSIAIALPNKYKLKSINNSLGASILSNFQSKLNGGVGQEGTCNYTVGNTTTEYHIYFYPITNGTVIDYKEVKIGK